MSLAFLFPGQGSQSVGMGRDLFENEDAARKRFAQADSILGRSISTLCFEGPKDALTDTSNTQPALFVCSVAACDALATGGVAPAAVAGHSLGEYPALYAAGVIDFETGLKLVALRGAAMAKAADGAMAAIIGLDIAQVETVCERASEGESLAVVANDNSPGQTVISGTKDAIDRACPIAKELGAKRALPLPVSGAFHSPLVEEARAAIEDDLKAATFNAPQCAYVSSVTAAEIKDPEEIRKVLLGQVTARVRWVETIQTLRGLGVDAALEVGPGKVLAGLCKRIDKALSVSPAGTIEAIGAAK